MLGRLADLVSSILRIESDRWITVPLYDKRHALLQKDYCDMLEEDLARLESDTVAFVAFI